VVFGYQYDQERLVHDANRILAFDADVRLQRAIVNEQSGELDLQLVQI